MANPNPVEAQLAAKAARTSHGYYRYMAISADDWPKEMRTAYVERHTAVMAMAHIDQLLDAGLVAQMCRFEVLLARIWKYLAEAELFNSKGDHQKILNVLGVYENSLTRIYDRLGLTPESRKRLGIKRGHTSLADVLSGQEVKVEASK